MRARFSPFPVPDGFAWSPERACRAIRGKPAWQVQWLYEIEIERAIKNAKRTDWDKWFRKQWYRAAAMRKWPERRRAFAAWKQG